MDFVSLKSKIADFDIETTNARVSNVLENPADTIYDDYGVLSEILNEDKVVKIGKYLIKVDLHSEQVMVLEDIHQHEYDDLVSNNPDNNNIMVFSTDDEVLELLENGSTGTINARISSCDAPRADRDRRPGYPRRGRRWRLDAKVAYQKAGIYFSLVAKGKTQKRRFRTWWRDYGGSCTIYYNCRFEVRCGWAYNRSASASGLRGKAIFRPYEGSKGLAYYALHGQFRSSHGNTDLIISDNY